MTEGFLNKKSILEGFSLFGVPEIDAIEPRTNDIALSEARIL